MNLLAHLMHRFAMWCHHTFGYEWGEIVFVVFFMGLVGGLTTIAIILSH